MRFQSVAAAAALSVALSSCAQAPAFAPSIGIGDNRPEGRRYVDYLLQDGGLTEISVDIANRAGAADRGEALSFLGQENFEPYNAPVLRDSRVERELTSLAACMIDAWGGPKPRVDVIIGSSLTPSAQALPNQISVNLGLIASSDITAGEIAFVLAHELSHVFLDHYERSEFLEQQKEIADTMAKAAILAVYASELRARKKPGGGIEFFSKDEGQVSEAAVYTLAAYAASQLVADGILESSWSRTQEYEADRLGLDLLENSAISNQFSYQALRRLATYQALQKTRLDRLEKAANMQMAAAVETGDPNMIIRAGADVFTKAAIAAALDIYDAIDVAHPTPADREGAIDGYLEEFASAPAVAPLATCRFDRLERALGERRVRNVYAAIQSAAEVDDLILEQNYQGARRAAGRSLTAGLERHPVTRMAAFRAENAAGRPVEALRHLQQIAINRNTPLAVHSTIAGEYLVRGRHREASRALDAGEKFFRRDFFLPKRLQIAFAEENEAAIIRYRAECDASTIESIRDACADVRRNRERAATDAALGDGTSEGGLFGRMFDGIRVGAEDLVQ